MSEVLTLGVPDDDGGVVLLVPSATCRSAAGCSDRMTRGRGSFSEPAAAGFRVARTTGRATRGQRDRDPMKNMTMSRKRSESSPRGSVGRRWRRAPPRGRTQDAAHRQGDEEDARLHFERTGGEDERGERERRRNQIEDRERNRPFGATRRGIARQPFARDPPFEPLFADLHAHPERGPGADDRSDGGQQRHEPPERASCAERIMTAASMPKGSEKNSVESSAASTKTPSGRGGGQ